MSANILMLMPRKASFAAWLRVALAVFCLALGWQPSRGEFPSSFGMTYITIDDGLARNFIDDIYRDSKGFVWFSLGGGGLVRYDGHSMLTFDEGSPVRPIPCDFVRNVAEDGHRRLWAATSSGLFAVDLNRMLTLDLSELSPKFDIFDQKSIASVSCDSNGHIWIGAGGVIYCVIFNEDGSVRDIAEYDTQIPYTNFIFRQIGDAVLTSFDSKIYALYLTPDFKIDISATKAEIPTGAIVSQIIQKGEDIWIGTSDGLVRHNVASRLNKVYTCVENDDRTLSQNYVTDLAIAPDNRLIVSTLCGYNIYNALTDEFTRVGQSNGGLNSPFINCMLVDDDTVWIGTEAGGVNLMSLKDIDCQFFPTAHPVNSIYADPRGTIWVGCIEGGLMQLTPGSNHLVKAADASNSLPHNSVSAITTDSSGRLWVGTWGGGIVLLDTDNPTTPLKSINNLAGYRRVNIGSIVYDYINDGIWIGANPGIFYYDCKSGRSVVPLANSDNMAFGPLGAVIDADGHLWMGCNDGLYDIDLRSRQGDTWDFRYLDRKLDAPEGNIKENISFLSLGPDGSLWAASDTHGIYHHVFDNTGETFVNYTTLHGIAKNAVKGIAFNGNILWASTIKGLTAMSLIDGSTKTYYKSNGLPDDSFYWNAAATTPDNAVYFGTISGLISVNSESTRHHTSKPVVFTTLTVDNAPAGLQYTDADISVADRVRLHERNRSFAVSFSSLDFTPGPSSKYMYMLEGFDHQWISLPEGRNDASYTNLAPGHYTLKVKYGPNGGVTSLPIDVQPYFYNTPWFMLLACLVIISLIWAVYRLRMRVLMGQKAALAMKVEERTREISAQQQRIEEQAMQMQQFTVERLSFFTNLTHEFRTPITLVLGPLEHAIKLTDNPKVQDQLQLAFRNAQYLMSLVNQLMDFRKIESGKMEIVRSWGDFRAFTEEVAQNFRNILQKRNIDLVTYYHLSDPEIFFDKEAMRKLLHNFLSNAAKYTPDGGTISIYAAALRPACDSKGRPMLYINVKDTGDGIDPQDIDKVFDKYYQGKTSMKYPSPMGSSGLGLHLCKSIVEAYGGTLQAKNNNGAGCSFRMLLPLVEEPKDNATTAQPAANAAESTLPTLLIVEDNPDMRVYLRGMLSERFNVIEAGDGKEALEKLKNPDVDFIISDLMMPRMDGLEFVRKLRENFETSHIPVLMLTAKTAQSSQLESFRLGVDGYLTKPFSEDMLLARIDAIIANRRLHNRKIMQSLANNPGISESASSALTAVDDSADARFIKQVMDTIKANYKNSYYEVGDFADNLGVSRTVLNKKLQSLLGKAANKLIRDYRLQVALNLIIQHRNDHTMNISEIAYDVGFNDSKYFTRCFTKHYGVPPSAVMQGADPVSTND